MGDNRFDRHLHRDLSGPIRDEGLPTCPSAAPRTRDEVDGEGRSTAGGGTTRMFGVPALALTWILLGSSGAAHGTHGLPPENGPETVFLVHGMGRTRWSMRILGERLERGGYRVHYFGYRTPCSSLDAVSRELTDAIVQDDPRQTYHLVGHSLGNVIIRNGFRTGFPEGLGRVVMLAPPNRPALLARKLAGNPLFRLATREPGQRLGDSEFYQSLPVPTVPFGVIAGTKSHTPLFNEPSDGVVTAASTRLAGMADWAPVNHTHTFLMNTGQTSLLVQEFLRNGRFRGDDTARPPVPIQHSTPLPGGASPGRAPPGV